MFYCDCCFAVVESTRCPSCGQKHLRPAHADDYCLLSREQKLWSAPLKDYLTQNGIPFISQRASSGGLAAYGLHGDEEERIYVRAMDLDRARELKESLSSENVVFLDENGEAWNPEED